MSNPITVEVCEVCENEFNLPMVRRRGGWQKGDASLLLQSDAYDVDDCDIGTCCINCTNKISNSFSDTVKEIKEKIGA